MWEIRGGGRVERGNMGLNMQEIFALCLVHMYWGADLHHTPMQIVWIDDWNCLELGNNIFVCFFVFGQITVKSPLWSSIALALGGRSIKVFHLEISSFLVYS